MAYLKVQILKFGLMGIINTGVDWGVYFLLTAGNKVEPTMAKGVGIAAGITSSFILNSLVVFRDDFNAHFRTLKRPTQRIGKLLKLYFKMVAAYSIGMAANLFVFYVCMKSNVPELISLGLSTLVSFAINFILSKNIVFKVRSF